MGICSSCLGFGRRESSNPETSRLLYDDPYRTQYGTNGQTNQRQSYQPDPETQRREREALEGLCHAMSDDVVDVFTILPRGDRGANGGARGQGGDTYQDPPESSNDVYQPSPVSLKQYKMEDSEPISRELAYRSVRKVSEGQRPSVIPNGGDDWEAAKAVMG